MSDFWTERLRATAPAAAPATPASYRAPEPGTPWWQQPTYETARVPTNPAAAQPGPLDVHPLTATPVPVRLAPSQQQTATCPSCGSGNYTRATPSSPLRCFDCNHGLDRAQHSTAGMSGIVGTQQGTTAPRAALAQQRGGFFPGVIVAHGM